MTRRARLALCFLVATATSCGSDESNALVSMVQQAPPPERAPASPVRGATLERVETPVTVERVKTPVTVDPLRVSLRAELGQEGETLVLTYTVQNDLYCDVYLFTPLREYDFSVQRWNENPRKLYASWRGQAADGVLELSKRLWPTPANTQVYAPESPRLTRVSPGAEYSERIPLPTPLPLNFPYRSLELRKRSRRAKHVRALTAVFSLGYLLGNTHDLRLQLAGPDLFCVPYGQGIFHQRHVASELELPGVVSVVEHSR
jgi:hypothetical protein